MAKGDELQKVGRAVAARRGELGKTQQELADAAHVDLKTIYNLESGSRWPIARTRAAISAALNWEGDALARIANGGEPPGSPDEPDIDWPIAPHPAGPFTREALAAAAPYARAMFRRLDELQGKGIERPAGFEMFPSDDRAADGWDDVMEAGYDAETAVQFISTLRGEAERVRREQHRDRSGTRGA